MEEVDSPISQVQFNTQVAPVSCPALRAPLANVTNGQVRLDRPTKMKSMGDEQASALFGLLEGQSNNKTRRPAKPAPRRSQASPLHRPATTEAHDSEDDQQTTHEQIQQPVRQVQTNDSNATTPVQVKRSYQQHVEHRPDVYVKTEASAPMPTALKENFKRWRMEAMAGRYVRRRACKIPKDQLKLLESEDCWQPAAPGKDTRPATLPIALLESLTAMADDKATRPCTCTSNISGDEHDAISDQDEEQKLHPRFSELDPSQELSASQWSPSPPRPRPAGQLPPDSPLAGSRYPVSEQLTHPESPKAARIAPPSFSSSEFAPQEESGASEQEDDQGNERHLVSSMSSTMNEGVDARHRAPKPVARVHVEQTPFRGKASTTKELLPDSTFVPSTYTYNTNGVSSTTPPKKIMGPPSMNRPQEVDGPVILEQSKRTILEHVESRPPKRPRTDLESRSLGPTLSQIERDKLEYRRKTLKSLSKPAQHVQRDEALSETRSAFCNGSSDLSKEEGDERVARSASESTSLTTPSTSQTPSPAPSLSKTHPSSSWVPSLAPSDVFERFRSAYKDYTGSESQFDEACTYLRKRRSANEGPHPSHFDDYIFHHHHAYQPYKRQMSEDGEDPVSYRIYFNDCIDSLDHRAKVVRVEFLDGLPPLRSSLSVVDTVPSPTALSNRLDPSRDKFMRSNNSVSNQSLQPATGPTVTAENRSSPAVVEEVVPDDLMNPSQRSSVKSWIEQTARAGSVELGTPEVDRSVEAELIAFSDGPRSTQASEVKATSSQPKKKTRLSASPFVSINRRKKEKWWKQPNGQTPFQQFFKAFSTLPGEQSGHAESVNPFSWRK